jgi:hypothetical protein
MCTRVARLGGPKIIFLGLVYRTFRSTSRVWNPFDSVLQNSDGAQRNQEPPRFLRTGLMSRPLRLGAWSIGITGMVKYVATSRVTILSANIFCQFCSSAVLLCNPTGFGGSSPSRPSSIAKQRTERSRVFPLLVPTIFHISDPTLSQSLCPLTTRVMRFYVSGFEVCQAQSRLTGARFGPCPSIQLSRVSWTGRHSKVL